MDGRQVQATGVGQRETPERAYDDIYDATAAAERVQEHQHYLAKATHLSLQRRPQSR
jgi:hypothetical protein